MSANKFTRLVYAPKAYAFIYSRKTGTVVDVSNDIMAGSVQRFVNQPSKAALTLRNDNFKYTGKFNPQFFPMDGITIWLQKIANSPIQVFTGFIDTIPFFQAYPGQIDITATCTLKQFYYTHFDPGVGFFEWLTVTKGWGTTNANNGDPSGVFNASAVNDTLNDTQGAGNDGGMGQLLHDFLVEIGGVDDTTIAIGDIPAALPEAMKLAYQARVRDSEAAEKNIIPFLERFMTMAASHSAEEIAAASTSALPGSISSTITLGDIKALAQAIEKSGNAIKPSIEQLLLAGVVMSGLDKGHSNDDKKSPAYGEGMFAEPPKSTSGEGAAAHSKNMDNSAGGQGKRFCDTFASIIKTSAADTVNIMPNTMGSGMPTTSTALSDEAILQTAKVLALGYGKEDFYAQIIESCRNETNIDTVRQIVDSLNSNQSLDGIASTDIFSMGEVVEKAKLGEITWEKIFKIDEQDTTQPQEMTADGKDSSKTRIVVEKNVPYTSPAKASWSPIAYSGKSENIINPDFPDVDGIPLKHSEVKYFVYARAVYDKNSRTIDAPFNDVNIDTGQIVLVKNNKTKKSCRCVYMGATNLSATSAPIAVSGDALNIIGRNGAVTFTFLEEAIPTVQDSLKPTSNDKRKDYIDALLTTIGPSAITKNSFGSLDITSDDVSTHDKYYTKANNRLAEYYYVAANCNLHLLDTKPGTNNLVLSSKDAVNAIPAGLRYLKELGVISGSSTADNIIPASYPQSIPTSITMTFDGGANVTKLTFNPKDNTVKKEPAPSSEQMKKAPVVIQVISGTNMPSPVWNGESARLPDSMIADAAGDSATGGGGSTITWADLAKMNTASAFTTMTSFPFDLVGSSFLVGEKSLMNDVPVIEGITQLCRGSMRNFMSLPNGMFAAFYPDYFGAFGRKPYLNIMDVEIIDFNIVLNDAPLVTHMYVNGNTIDPFKSTVDQFDQVMSAGVITIDDMFTGAQKGLNFINNPGAATGTGAGNKSPDNIDYANAATPSQFTQFYEKLSPESLRFLQTYGTRPKVMNEPMIRSPWFEFITAYNEFTYSWSMHTATTVEMTFMPELMAGGLVRFPEHNINMYCEAVTHQWNYTSGFETTAMLSAPSTYVGTDEFGKEVPPEEPVPGLAIFNKVGYGQ